MANGFCRPFWKLGSGHYGKTLGQNTRDAINSCEDLVLEFVAAIPVEKSTSFTLADHGTTDGFASLHLFERIIRQVKDRRGEHFPVQVIYEDQQDNDFPSLFMWLADETSYMSKFRQVYPMATAISFYNQCVPDSTCDVIFTSMTTHWLDSLDGIKYKHGIFYSMLGEDEEDTKHRVSQIAERDWIKFLRHRARELKPGGLLVVVGLRVLKESDLAKKTGGGECAGEHGSGLSVPEALPNINIEKELDTAWKKLREEGRITQAEFEDCVVENYWRTAEKMTSPLEADPVLAGEEGLALVHYDEVVHQLLPKQLWLQRRAMDGVDDRKFFARLMTSTHRTWSDGVFRKSLSSERTAVEKDAILDRLYKHFEDNLRAMNPEEFNAYYAISRLIVRKR